MVIRKVDLETVIGITSRIPQNSRPEVAFAGRSNVGKSSLINTLMGMAVDIEKRKRVLSIGTGGLSGPAVKPVALRMVWQVARAVKIPVIGLGGIMTAEDALEFLMCGASAIEIGTANFIDPAVTMKVRDGINDWLDAHGISALSDIVGTIDR